MATYTEIQKYVKENNKLSIKTCWIAHMKELTGLPLKKAPNRKNVNYRLNPCPDEIKPIILNAFKKLKMI
jgi:hypothetical protein